MIKLIVTKENIRAAARFAVDKGATEEAITILIREHYPSLLEDDSQEAFVKLCGNPTVDQDHLLYGKYTDKN